MIRMTTKEQTISLSDWDVITGDESWFISCVFHRHWKNVSSFQNAIRYKIISITGEKYFSFTNIDSVLQHIETLKIQKESYESFIGQKIISKQERLQGIFHNETEQATVLEPEEENELSEIVRNCIKELLLYSLGKKESLFTFYTYYFSLLNHQKFHYNEKKKKAFSSFPKEEDFADIVTKEEFQSIERFYESFLMKYHTKEEIETMKNS